VDHDFSTVSHHSELYEFFFQKYRAQDSAEDAQPPGPSQRVG
jgi:hypothetical protein